MRTITPALAWRPLLLSAAVFPGLGQWVDRRYGRALAFAGGSAALVLLLLRRVWIETTARLPEDPADVASTLVEDPGWPLRLAAQIQRENASFFFWVTTGIVALWALSILDAWRDASRRAASRRTP